MLRSFAILFTGLILVATRSESVEKESSKDSQDHWAFRPPVIRSPETNDREISPDDPLGTETLPSRFATSIDAFIETRRSELKLTGQPPAQKPIWLRRVYLDLIGLPPTLEEIHAFEMDDTPSARQKVIERLLASPYYGERWGRHFMDIWRYSDWWGLGAQLRYSQKHIWRWRDWIVESLNADRGYDQMVMEQLAGDELAPTDTDTLRATGFLARNYYLFNRTTWLEDVVEHTGKAFLGLTLNCAKCHDHKYDPISQTDYYAWRAIFEPYHVRLDELPGETDFDKNGLPRVYDLHLEKSTYVHLKGDSKNPDLSRVIEPSVPTVFAFSSLDIQPVTLPPSAHHPTLQPWVLPNHLKAAETRISTLRKNVDKARRKRDETELAPELRPESNNRSEVVTVGADASSRVEADANKAANDSETLPPLSPLERARSELAAAKSALAAAELRPAMVRAVFNADAARFASTMRGVDLNTLATSAAAAETNFKLAEAEAALAKARLDLLIADSKKKEAAEKKLKTVADALEKVREKAVSPGTNYTSLRASRKALEGPDETEANRIKPHPRTSTGRRLALARWIVDRQNPLTARVLVNHVWTRHFGQPLVSKLTDFGLRSPPPLHQNLLDWLAVDFMDNGWSLKRLHRQIVLSDTYAMSSSANGTRDPENLYYQRMNTQRLDAHSIRDSLLYLAGMLDLKLGGPTVDPKKDDTAMRRSLYFTQSPEDLHKFLETFDNANTKECYRRAESILPQQALALANSKLASVASAKLAEWLMQSASPASDDNFIRTAFETILVVKPTSAEYEVCVEGLERLTEAARVNKAPEPETRARKAFVHALLNHNDFITIR